jgi:hypothetical protein
LSFFIIAYVFSSTKLDKGGTGSAWKQGGVWEEAGEVDRQEKWPKQCMHM